LKQYIDLILCIQIGVFEISLAFINEISWIILKKVQKELREQGALLSGGDIQRLVDKEEEKLAKKLIKLLEE